MLIKIGGVIGALPTIALVVVTAMVGVALLRQQGLATLGRVQTALDRGELPANEMLEGIALLVGGALLLTPGFVTDGLGLFCLIPTTRRILVRAAFTRVMTTADSGTTPADPHSPKQGRVLSSNRILIMSTTINNLVEVMTPAILFHHNREPKATASASAAFP